MQWGFTRAGCKQLFHWIQSGHGKFATSGVEAVEERLCVMSLPPRTAEINLSGHLDSVTMSALVMTCANK